MTSAHGYFEPWDYKYLYDKHPKRGFIDAPEYKSDTIMGYLNSVPSLSLFCYLIKLAGFDSMLNSHQTECTMLVVSDSNLDENEILLFDKYEARKLVQYHIIPKKISMNTIFSRKIVKVNTLLNADRLLFNSLSGNLLINDRTSVLISDVLKSNGYVNVISSVVSPS